MSWIAGPALSANLYKKMCKYKDPDKRVWGCDIRRLQCADPGDVILKVTSTAICGSDLHLYLNALPGMKAGDLLGHEVLSPFIR